MAEPTPTAPRIPSGYGVPRDESGADVLPWSWAVERLEAARNYWLCTTRSTGRPHAAPVWGVWLDGAVHFSTGGRTRKARHLAANPACVVTPERADEAVVLEGVAERVTEPGELSRLLAVYVDKYGSGFPDPDDNPVFAVRPRVVIGLIEREPEYTTRATRWRFAPAAPADPGRRSQ